MSKQITCILIDDEVNNNALLKKIIQRNCPNVNVIATESDPIKGLKMIEEFHPDLVFLDIQMPSLDGFELLKKLEPVDFEVVFVTAYTEFAITAFDYDAIGYLTKPVDEEKLIRVVETARQRIELKSTSANIFSLLEKKMHHQEESKISLSTLNGMIFVQQDDIVYCESNGRYTNFYIRENKKIVVSKSIGEFEKILPHHNFVRIHDRYMVNLKHVSEYIKGRGGEIKLNHTITLPVSIQRKEYLLSRFGKWMNH